MSRVLVCGLTKRFGAVTAVDNVSFTVGEAEFVTLLGPSGCGKTTTLRCIAGLEHPDAGEIRIGDTVVAAPAHGIAVPPHRRGIGMVFQNYAVWPHKTVYANVAYPLEVRHLPKARIGERVREVLALVGLAELADRPATKLSGGQQQRVALARALAAEPRLLLMDEPLSNLDAKLRERTRQELQVLQRRLGITVIYVTHDQTEALALSDRIIVFNRGRIQQDGTPAAIYERPANAFVADFVGRTNFLRVRLDKGDARSSNGYRAASTASGALLLLPPLELAAGRDPHVLLSVRPHAVELWPAGTSPPGLNTLRGIVSRTAYLGERLECWVVCEGTEWCAYLPTRLPGHAAGAGAELVVASRAVAPGVAVDVAFAPDAAIVLADDAEFEVAPSAGSPAGEGLASTATKEMP